MRRNSSTDKRIKDYLKGMKQAMPEILKQVNAYERKLKEQTPARNSKSAVSK